MKTRDQIQVILDELRAVCRKHGVVLVGTCDVEGIFSELCSSEPNEYLNPQVDNKLFAYIDSCEFCVSRIGDVP